MRKTNGYVSVRWDWSSRKTRAYYNIGVLLLVVRIYNASDQLLPDVICNNVVSLSMLDDFRVSVSVIENGAMHTHIQTVGHHLTVYSY